MNSTWNRGDRVRVLRGEHEGRTGTVAMLPSDPYARYMYLGPSQVRVALDGEPGQVAVEPGAGGRGGRGGIPIIIAATDLEPYDGSARHRKRARLMIFRIGKGTFNIRLSATLFAAWAATQPSAPPGRAR